MKWSELLLPTLKEMPREAEAISHILMIRAGLIRKLTSGVYSYLPLGVKVLKKVEQIIIEEMNAKGAQQLFLPAIQPAELWHKSGRFQALGEDMVTFTDRHKKLNVLGPTHEEVITALVKNEVSSYRQLPLILYQIQTKFRDEARPRFGVMRSREFIMKDAYSFDRDAKGLHQSYEKMYDAYCRIFKRCGLRSIPVEADCGIMGGDVSHEFMVLAESGEDEIVRCRECQYAASMNKAECMRMHQETKAKSREAEEKKLKEVKTPDARSVKDVAQFLKVSPQQLVKTILYVSNGKPFAVLIRGDHEINEAKLSRVLNTDNLVMADEEIIKRATNGPLGFSGPIGLQGIEIIADYALKGVKSVVIGANKQDTHIINANPDRDFSVARWADVRKITDTDLCPRCGGNVMITRAIEVGHVFKLGTKYTDAFGATFLDEKGLPKSIIMGCYGIGVTRIIAACIEQHYDADGIIWPMEISPFQVIVLALNIDNTVLAKTAFDVYGTLAAAQVEVIFDDRHVRAGIKFKDADLIGIPVQVIIGEQNLKKGLVEIKIRGRTEKLNVPVEEIVSQVKKSIRQCL